jgi:hypothetical protein
MVNPNQKHTTPLHIGRGWGWVIVIILYLTSCGDIENEYSNHAAYLRYDNSNHLDQTIGAAISGVSPNIFCRIYVTKPSYLNFQNNQKASSAVKLAAIETQSPLILGLNNETGIIVGYGLDGTLYCYDACCANCYNKEKMFHVLSMNTAGIATCSRCNRQYDLTNNGLSPQGGRLERYYATVSPNHLVLFVNNYHN